MVALCLCMCVFQQKRKNDSVRTYATFTENCRQYELLVLHRNAWFKKYTTVPSVLAIQPGCQHAGWPECCAAQNCRREAARRYTSYWNCSPRHAVCYSETKIKAQLSKRAAMWTARTLRERTTCRGRLIVQLTTNSWQNGE